MTHIFTYGSLMFEQVWNRVVSGRYQHHPGTVSGFVRRALLHEHYPAMLPGPVNERVVGFLYLNLDEEDVFRLDEFEGSIYERRAVQVMTDNNIFTAEAYVLKDSYRHIVSDQNWDPEKFKSEGIHRFLSTYFGFDR
jgi:gamma-glutamylcyclotransferase (GGCT)/AIG2-like uncharacterized protein YtfP